MRKSGEKEVKIEVSQHQKEAAGINLREGRLERSRQAEGRNSWELFPRVQLARNKPSARRSKAVEEVGSCPWVQTGWNKATGKLIQSRGSLKEDPVGSNHEIKPTE